MIIDPLLVDQIATHVEVLLAPLGQRWVHVQGVAEKARRISSLFSPEEATRLVAAAYLHDIGYAPALKQTGFHPLDGAYSRSCSRTHTASPPRAKYLVSTLAQDGIGSMF